MVVVVVELTVVVVSVVVLVEIVLVMGWTAAALRAYVGERTLICTTSLYYFKNRYAGRHL